MADFPRLSLEPGRYAAEWHVNGRLIAGELETAADRPPRVVLFDDVDEVDWALGRELPAWRAQAAAEAPAIRAVWQA